MEKVLHLLACFGLFLNWLNDKCSLLCGTAAVAAGVIALDCIFSHTDCASNGNDSKRQVYSRAEVEKHNSLETGVWVSYRDGVYDITSFLSSHPGGADKLMLAAGEDLFPIWKQAAFRQHFGSPVALQLLEEMRIGTLRPEDVVDYNPEDIEKLPLQYSTKKIYDCIVVGAGVSGLRCAHSLTTDHRIKREDVLLLEAQDYVGGRVREISEFIKGINIEVGAEFLHGTDTHLTRLAESFEEPKSPIYCWAHGDGGPLQEPVHKGYGLYYIGGDGDKKPRLLRYDDPDPEFQRLNKELWKLPELSEIEFDNSKSLTDYLAPKGFDTDMLRMANAGYANTLCSNSDELAMHRVVKWSRLWDAEGEEEGDFSLDNSWSAIIGHLKENLQIETGSPVCAIDYAPNSNKSPFSDLVKVTTKDGITYYAKTVVVTSSPHVLKNDLIKFEPPLNDGYREALESVNMNKIVKVFMKFSRPVWPKNLAGMIISDKDFLLPEIWFNDVSGRVDEDEPAKAYAVAFTTTDYAERLSALPRREVLKQSIEQLDKMFSLLQPQHMAADLDEKDKEVPEELPKPSSAFLGAMYWDWNAEHHPYIGGGYCSPKVNRDTDAIDKLRLPYGNNNIFFAGEATNLPGATAHAALESGVRSAQQVADVLKKNNSN